MSLFQKLLDIIRLKELRRNKLFIRHCMNFAKLLGSDYLTACVLRFAGAKVGKNFQCGIDLLIQSPQNLVIGDNCIIGDKASLYAWNKIEIGEYTLISANVSVIAGSHSTEDFGDLNENQEVKIGKGCWIGCNATFLGGSNIPNGCVVGAGALVLHRAKFEPLDIIAGCPAKVIKKRKPAETIMRPFEYKFSDVVEVK